MPGNGIVLTGGGARAAYQVGVLRAIADMYPDWEHPFRVIVGTSAGAINAMAIAGSRGRFRHSIDHLEKVWSGLTMDQVFRADPFSMVRNVTSIARRMLARPSEGGPVSFLDNRPLRKLLEEHIDFERVRDTLSAGHIDAVGLNACGYASGQNVCFFQGRPDLQGWSQGQRAGTRTELTIDHILASSAIPTLFRPVAINREYFGDGVTRQMAHISPALRLGATKVLVIGVSANAMCPPKRHHQQETPSLSQILAQVFNGMFLDTLEYDIEHSRMINQLLALIPPERLKEANLDLHPVDILEISPSQPLDELAAPHMGALPPLVRTLTGEAESVADGGANLASYLLFDNHFCKTLMELGYRDGQAHANQIQRFFNSDE
ncbi:patatin-like phospholipase family protein [Marinobacter koreensis]|uniref:Patatin-like phospholipase family protein n=2 Tax=Marinobacter koreensis TaxID=335974 RepID=A0ABW0RR68_9GAMM|nr:patatin-like phospholipase family protein [Marinobacter koreensis]MCK7547839.1 patatin-like phospholipase family protein [Marinobacter koreensis]